MAELNGMQGNEIADDFTRKGTQLGRWKATWEVFKSSFWKLVALNLITLLFFLPGIGVIWVRGNYIAGLGTVYPFNTTAGNFPPEQIVGLAERLTLSADLLFYAALLIAGLIASIGVSGTAYCIRRLLLTNGSFKFGSFFHGIKVGYFNTALPVTLFLLFIYSATLTGDWVDYTRAVGGNLAGAIAAYVCVIVVTVLFGIYLAWVFSVGISYRVKMRHLFRNAFVLMIGTPIQTVFMAAFSLIPVWLLFLKGFWVMIGAVLMIFFGLSYILLCWLSFTQWAFDGYITPAIKAEKEAAAAKKTDKELAAEKAEEDKRTALELLAAGRSELVARPILPISNEVKITPLGKTFSRNSLAEVEGQRQSLAKEVADYEKQHINDPVYVEYNKMFDEREKALSAGEGKKAKKKKISADNLLK